MLHHLLLDLDAGRLEKAKTLGATHTVQVTSKDSRQLADKIIETLGCPPEKTIECSGAQSSIATGMYVCMITCANKLYMLHLSLRQQHQGAWWYL